MKLSINTESSNEREIMSSLHLKDSSWHCIKCLFENWRPYGGCRALKQTSTTFRSTAGPEEQTKKQQKALLTLFCGKWEQSEREGECLWDHFLSFLFFLVCLPQLVSMCHRSVTKREKNPCMGSLFDSAGKDVNLTVATSRSVEEKFKKRCSLCGDFCKPHICQQLSVCHTFHK